MKLTAPHSNFVAALQHAGRVVSTRATLPSLAGIMFTAADGVLTLRSTDMEMSLTVAVADAKIEQDGSVLLPGRLLADVARSLPEGEITMELRPEQRDVELTARDARFHFRTLDVADFPTLPEAQGEAATLPAGALVETIDRVVRAASNDEVRPILTGVLVQAEGQKLTMVATDSYRLSVKHTQMEQPLAEPIDANVPARALRELQRLIEASGAESVETSLSRNQVVFRLEGAWLSSRLIEGQFPSWRQLVPESFEHEVRMPREDLLDVVRRVSNMAQRNAPLRFAFSDGELRVAAETPDIGDAAESLPAPFSGEPLEIAFNPQYLREGIESVQGDQIAIQISSPLRPGLLRPVGDEDFSYLVMPIRLNV